MKLVELKNNILNNKSILFVTNNIRIGGAAKMINYVIDACSDFFGSVFVVSSFDEEKDFSVNNVSYYFLHVKPKNGFLWRFSHIKRIRNIIKRNKPDIVCAFISDEAVVTRIATLGIKTIMTSAERGDPYSLPFFWKLLTKWAYKRSDYCFFQLDKACTFFPKKVQKKSFIIPNPFFGDEISKPYKGERNKTIVSAGRFCEQKGFDVLIKAFYLVHKRHPDYTLIIYGDGGLKSEYVKLVEQLKLNGLVFLPGYSNDIPKIIRKEGMFVLSSRFEGIPNSMIEAMSVGLPTIATDCSPGGPAFLNNNGKYGLLIPCEDSLAMADAICLLIENKELASYYSKAGLEVAKKLKPEAITSLWIKAFNEIIKK